MTKRILEIIGPLTLLVALLGQGCSTATMAPRTLTIKNRLAQAELLTGQGRYKEAIDAYERVIEAPADHPWLDRALFGLGRLHCLNGNPEKDFARSLYCFQRLRTEFPKSRLNTETPVWVGLLEKVTSLEFELRAKQAEMEKETARLRTEAQARTAELDQKSRKLRELEDLIQTQKTAIGALESQLKKMKEIDIKAEKKAKGID